MDRWGQHMSGSTETLVSWDQAWDEFLHFRTDPIVGLDASCRNDETNVLGPVFTIVYLVLAGSPLDSLLVATQLKRARQRSANGTEREAAHVAAVDALAAGNFTAAAERWDAIARNALDFAAVRFAHDVYLHVGDADRRLASSRRAYETWGDGPGASFIAGQYSFALEEIGRYADAERIGRRALDVDPDDLWARHALAHVYESLASNTAFFELLRDTVDRWQDKENLATHIWWHLALRLLDSGDVDGALGVFDQLLPTSTTAFRLSDQSSLLWRVELAGHEVGNRWNALADRWDGVVERHTCAFLDLHAAITFIRRPDHPGASRWFSGLVERPIGTAENDRIFADVVVPLVAAFRAFAHRDHCQFVSKVDALGAASNRIGGSVVQRDLIRLTRQASGAPP